MHMLLGWCLVQKNFYLQNSRFQRFKFKEKKKVFKKAE
jgi:hypothetical protein